MSRIMHFQAPSLSLCVLALLFSLGFGAGAGAQAPPESLPSASAPTAPGATTPPAQPAAPETSTEPAAPPAQPSALPPADQATQPDARPPTETTQDDATPLRQPAPPAEPAPPTQFAPPSQQPEPAVTKAYPPIYEPPLPGPTREIDAVPPPTPQHRSPRAALWLGARGGWLFPTGALWQDGLVVDRFCCVYEDRAWRDFASSGPMFEFDLGARIARRYTVFGLWEYASLGTGQFEDDFGGQLRGDSHLLGAGFRFSTDPDDIGLIVEVALGWRYFRASWEAGTELVATDDFFNTRLGLGMDIRINEYFSLSPMATLGGGVFTDIDWNFANGGSESAIGPFSGSAQHTVFTLQMGAHFDLLQSKN